MAACAVEAVSVGEPIGRRLRHQITRGQRFELADGVGVHRHRRMAPRLAQCPVLCEELDIGDTTATLLEVETVGA